MSDGLVVNSRVTIPEAELRVSFATSGGPGGQHVNKTATKVELRWNPRESNALREHDKAWLLEQLGSRLSANGDLIVTSADHRSQHRNRKDARVKLVEIVSRALKRPVNRKKTRPTRASVERRVQAKKQAGQKKRGRAWKPDD